MLKRDESRSNHLGMEAQRMSWVEDERLYILSRWNEKKRIPDDFAGLEAEHA